MKPKVEVLENQLCPMCHKKTLTLREAERDIAYFGKVFIFSMECSDCGFFKADVELATKQDPVKYSFNVESEDDLNVRVVKSAQATIKIPHVTTISPGPASQGGITNIEGILLQVKKVIEEVRDNADDESEKKRARKLIKKLSRVLSGRDKLKLIIEDPTGNSAIISEKAKKAKLK